MSSSGGKYMVSGDLYNLTWEKMEQYSYCVGSVYIYSNYAASGIALLAKHHGVIVDIQSQSHYWAIQRFDDGMEYTRGKRQNGDKQAYLGVFSVRKIINAIKQSLNGKNYNVFSNNCNHWVQRFVRALGFRDVSVGMWSSISYK